jgi:hypothetical protein
MQAEPRKHDQQNSVERIAIENQTRPVSKSLLAGRILPFGTIVGGRSTPSGKEYSPF